MRGEQLIRLLHLAALMGSPPHARGAVADRVPWGQHYGITPACAGSRLCLPILNGPYRDHPRMRGEQVWLIVLVVLLVGSPPHARGAGNFPLALPDLPGITPACAGSSSENWDGGTPIWDHPRMRGEQLVMMFLPPLVIGITPACAGSSESRHISPGHRRDHPRMRGEQFLSRRRIRRRLGSPPHARGAVTSASADPSKDRITPACAGSSNLPATEEAQLSDHPRMRGEQSLS